MEQMKGLSARSEEVQEIMGRPPHWTLKWGLILLVMLVAALAALAYAVRYPVTVRVRLSASEAEKTICVKTESAQRLLSVNVHNGQQVLSGDTLAHAVCAEHGTPQCITLQAPADGVVSFAYERAEGMSFKAGETLFLLQRPSDASHAAGRFHGFLTPVDARRVKPGMKVRLLPSATMASEVSRQATVANVAASANERGLLYFEVDGHSGADGVAADCPDGCEAEIVVSNPRIIQRLMPHLPFGRE